MKILPKAEFQKWLWKRDITQGMSEDEAAFDVITTAGIHTMPEDEIVVSKGMNTTERLHEIGHKVIGRPKLMEEIEHWTMGDIAYQEIMAQKFAWEKMGKLINYRIGKPALFALNYEEKLSPKESVDVVVEVLERMGIPVPSEGKKELRGWVRKYKRVV